MIRRKRSLKFAFF